VPLRLYRRIQSYVLGLAANVPCLYIQIMPRTRDADPVPLETGEWSPHLRPMRRQDYKEQNGEDIVEK